MLYNYFKTAFRSLLINKGFTIINVLGLALGLAICMLIVFYVIDELNYDKYNSKADNIYRINTDIKFGGNTSSYAITPPPLKAALLNLPEIETATRLLHDVGVRVKKGNENIQEERVAYADANLFNVFTLPMIQGNATTALVEPNTVVLTESTAKKYFNSVNVIGKTLLVNLHTIYKVTGVITNVPSRSHFNFDFFFSSVNRPEYKVNNWLNFVCTTYIVVKPNAIIKNLQAKLPLIVKNGINTQQAGADMNLDKLEKMGNYIRLSTTPLKDIHLRSNRQYELGANSNIQYIYVFLTIAIFILLLACINFINLATARSANRAREVGIRKVLGSSRNALIAQFISESVIVALASTFIAFLIAWALLPVFNMVSGKVLAITAPILMYLCPILLINALIIGLFAGVYPAFFLSAFQPIHVLKGKLSIGFKGGGIRNVLVVLQFAISIFLIIGTLVIFNQLNYIQHKDLGFNRNQVLVVKNTLVLGAQAKTLLQEVKQLSGVANATLSAHLPTGKNRNPDAVFANRTTNPKSALYTEIWPVDEYYLNTTGMTLIKGRNFSREFSSDTTGIIINEAAAKLLGFNNDPLNKKLYTPQPSGAKEYHVLGVVKDFNFNSLRDNITPVVMILGHDADDSGLLSIRFRNPISAAAIAQIEQKWKSFAPDEHFDYSFMDEDFNAAYRAEQSTGTLFLLFTILAILIACLGLFGLTAYAVEQRTREISIRKILGAGIPVIVTMLSKDFIKLVVIALVIATPLAWLIMQKWLQGFAYHQNLSWLVIVSAGSGAIIIAFITISFQSIKAATANPANSLRGE